MQRNSSNCRTCTARLSETPASALQVDCREEEHGCSNVPISTQPELAGYYNNACTSPMEKHPEGDLKITARALKDAMAAEESAVRELEEAARIMREDWKVTAMEVVGQRKSLRVSTRPTYEGPEWHRGTDRGEDHGWVESNMGPVVKTHTRLTLKDKPMPIGHVVKLVMNGDDRLQQVRAAPWRGPPPILRHMTSTAWQREQEKQNRQQEAQKKQLLRPPKAVTAAFDARSLEERRLPARPETMGRAMKMKAPFTTAGQAKMLCVTEAERCGTTSCRTRFPVLEGAQVTSPRMTWWSLLGGCQVCIEECKLEKHGVVVPPGPTDDTKQFHRAW